MPGIARADDEEVAPFGADVVEREAVLVVRIADEYKGAVVGEGFEVDNDGGRGGALRDEAVIARGVRSEAVVGGGRADHALDREFLRRAHGARRIVGVALGVGLGGGHIEGGREVGAVVDGQLDLHLAAQFCNPDLYR